MQKSNQSQAYLEDSRVRINCSISSQTGQDSQYAVLWYVRHTSGSEADELLLRIERSGTFEYGAYADEERLRRRLQAERLSPRLYVLTLNRAESSDSGTYYCLVEEWLSDPDGAWYRVSRDTSGFTQVLVRRPGERTNCFLIFPAGTPAGERRKSLSPPLRCPAQGIGNIMFAIYSAPSRAQTAVDGF